MFPQHFHSHKGSYLVYCFERDDEVTNYNSVLVWHGVFVPVFYQHKKKKAEGFLG